MRQNVHISHLSPKAVENIISDYLKIACILTEIDYYLSSLKQHQNMLGIVFESLVYEVEQIMM